MASSSGSSDVACASAARSRPTQSQEKAVMYFHVIDDLEKPLNIEDLVLLATAKDFHPGNGNRLIEWCQNRGVLAYRAKCRTCDKDMTLVRRKDAKDGFKWQCGTCAGRPHVTIRKGTLFEGSRMSLKPLIYIMFGFVKDKPAFLCERDFSAILTYESVLTFYEEFRKIVSWKISTTPVFFTNEDVVVVSPQYDIVQGEDGKVLQVEIDESWFGKKAKYHRGTSRQNVMVFGIVAKKGKKCALYVAETNSIDCLWPLIQKHVHTSCGICHDGLRTYDNLHSMGYEHSVVNHSETFVAEDGTHTNTIEGLWGLLKRRISYMQGCNQSNGRLEALLDEFNYRRNYSSQSGVIDKNFFIHMNEYNNHKYSARQ